METETLIKGGRMDIMRIVVHIALHALCNRLKAISSRWLPFYFVARYILARVTDFCKSSFNRTIVLIN